MLYFDNSAIDRPHRWNDDLSACLECGFLIDPYPDGIPIPACKPLSATTVVTLNGGLNEAKATNVGRKDDSGKAPLDLLSPAALFQIAAVMEHGSKKYAAHNWRNGLAYSRLVAAVLRHINLWNVGVDRDTETGLSHLAHAGAGLLMLLEFTATEKHNPDNKLDDRYKSEALQNAMLQLYGGGGGK